GPVRPHAQRSALRVLHRRSAQQGGAQATHGEGQGQEAKAQGQAQEGQALAGLRVTRARRRTRLARRRAFAAQLPRNSTSTGASTPGSNEWVCPGSERTSALGRASATAAAPRRMNGGLSPPSRTSAGPVTRSHVSGGIGSPRENGSMTAAS